MCSEEPSIVEVLFNTQKNDCKISIYPRYWFEELGITKILFNIQMLGSINLLKVCDPRSQAQLRFCLILGKIIVRYQFTQGMWFEEPSMTKVLFDTQMSRNINLSKACGPRSQAQLRFCLILIKMIVRYRFTQGMWSEELGMTKVLFDTQIDSRMRET